VGQSTARSPGHHGNVDRDADVVAWLGIASATANDTAFITTAVNAANAYAYRRRREAGYYDSLSTVPSADVKLGTIMFAGSLYRERGIVDSFASFEQMGTPVALARTARSTVCWASTVRR
jgi:hypothetical protein